MKEDDTRILDGNAPEDSDTKILNSTPADESTVVVDSATRIINAPDESTHIEEPVVEPQQPSELKPAAPAKKSKAWIAWLVGIVVLGGVGAGAWYLFGDSNNDVNAQADHSDDDEFENFGRVRRAIEQNIEDNYGSSYEATPDYYIIEDSLAAAPAAEEVYYDYSEEAVAPAEEAVPAVAEDYNYK